MVAIDPRFVDYDFTQDPNYVKGDLSPQTFGTQLPCRGTRYEDAAPMVPESQWEQLAAQMDADGGGLERLITRILNQLQEGSCVGNASTQADQIIQAKMFGKDKVTQLSAISLYKRIGSSANSGAMIDDALHELLSRGIVPLDTPENRSVFKHVMPATGFRTPWPTGWEETAAMFKGHEYLECRGVNELMSALFNGHPVVVGRAGHSICYCRPQKRNGVWVVKYVNSWGEWGDAGGDFNYGFGYDSMNLIRQSATYAWALRTLVNRTEFVPSIAI